MKIATLNINNVVKRLDNLLAWLDASRPDVVCLQETKVVDALFPAQALAEAGYSSVFKGERTYNGVALLARGVEPVVTRRSLPGDADDAMSRYIEAAVGGVLIGCIYAPNGNPVPGPKFGYKLAWLERLNRHAQGLLEASVPVALVGDFNVVPTDFDIYRHKSRGRDAVIQPEARAAFRRLLDQGWTDALRTLHPDDPQFTFWDYFRDAWGRDAGMRLDHFLLSPALAGRLKAGGVDRWARGEEGASDHAPAWIELKPKRGAARR
ncbi:exodeoxyribonuclease III [Phenylobacterium sp.]|jgi:exodeoxyribonuclease-3|uniref:exodeoxyribonuclease III n=1 Tax=Phenylobacterium sp. TaxID=1871053 RepID=UPI002F92581F